MDPELQGDQNREYKPSYNIEVTRDEAPELRETHQDFSQLAKEEAQVEGGSFATESGASGGPMTKAGEPDRRFTENQDQGQDQGQNQGYQMETRSGGRNAQDDRGNQQTEHLTKTGEPDMRFKENQEAYGQS